MCVTSGTSECGRTLVPQTDASSQLQDQTSCSPLIRPNAGPEPGRNKMSHVREPGLRLMAKMRMRWQRRQVPDCRREWDTR